MVCGDDRIERMEKTKHICVCDDEVAIADLVGQLLDQNGYSTSVFYSGKDMLEAMDTHAFDLVILDIMMPVMDGFSCCQEIRKKSHAPIIFLTAKDSEIDKVVGLELGADDYITKPFKPREFVARVKARLRRHEPLESVIQLERYEAKGIAVDGKSYEAFLHDEVLALTPKEFGILLYLIKKRGYPVSSADLYTAVWDEPADYQSNNTVMVHVRHLRKKLAEIDSSQEFIATVWGIGYKVD